MKTIIRTASALLLGAALIISCEKKQDPVTYTMTADRTSISDVAANNPSDETLVLKTNATSWLVLTPDWVTATPNSGAGSENGTIITLKIASNYKNEATDTAPRSGVLKFSGSGATLDIPINQLGHTAVIDPNASIGGITDLGEFQDFVTAVNEGNGLSRWLNADGEVELLADIDISSVTDWTPIGNVTATGNGNNASKPEGPVFSGTFNGGGHTIKNFKASTVIPAGGTWGLFGCTMNATIKNLILEADVTLEAAETADAGVLVGTAYSTTIQSVQVKGKVNVKGSQTNDKRFAIGGIAGFVFSIAADGVSYDTTIKDCVVDLAVTGNSGANVKNGATGVHFGGIAGFCTNPKDDSRNHIEDCTFQGSLGIDCGRCAGIAGVGNFGTIFKGCVNNADQVNGFANGREAGVVCVIAEQCAIIDCVNNGNLTTTDAKTQAGGIFTLLNHATCYVEGGANYGTILCAFETDDQGRRFAGLVGANFSKFDHVSGVTVSGKIGTDANNIADVNAGNFMDYIGYRVEGADEKISNLNYVAK